MGERVPSDQAVLDAAWAWAESTRGYPAGDADAEGHLLECAQTLFNDHQSGPPIALRLSADDRAALALIAKLTAEVLHERRPAHWNTLEQHEAHRDISDALSVLSRLLGATP